MTDPNAQIESRPSSTISKVLSGLFLVVVVAGGWIGVGSLNSSPKEDLAVEPNAENAASGGAGNSDITLPDAKVAKAGFETTASRIRTIEDVRTVAGRLTYDEAQHIEVKAPVSGVLVDVLVKPGDVVKEGQLLAILDSPEIGKSRAAILSKQASLRVIEQQIQRLDLVTKNLRILFGMLDRDAALDDVEAQFKDKPLGMYRKEIMSVYSQRLLANQLLTIARPLVKSGSVSLRTVQERENDRHVVDAQFRSVRETTAYEIGVRLQQLQTDRNHAHRQVMIAQNQLMTLLGFADNNQEEATAESLSRMEVRAPFAATVEARSFAKRERVRQSDSLFVLANTDSLYVSAEIRENEWAAMSIEAGQNISVLVPAISGRTFLAKVHYIGREVDVESNSLPLVATISNADGLFRPGMFVRVAIPVAQSNDVVAVPSESVMQHENEKFIFVSVSDHTFRRVDVETGMDNEEWVEIKKGLKAGEPVVAKGAFLLKSELLLAGEQE